MDSICIIGQIHCQEEYFFCHLQIKTAPFLIDFQFKSALLDLGIIWVINRRVESEEILAQRPPGGAGRPEGQNLGNLIALCG